ncbi:MAG: HNH endonuclease [Cytophagales bacterium]|nr:HNH endonuclease [Cytophagales bacterium]
MNGKVLILNQDFRALTICSVQRAFLLNYLKKSELIKNFDNQFLRTVTRSYPVPSIIRLYRYVNLPYRGVMLSRQNIYRRDGHKCQYCSSRSNLTLDHVIPISKGGNSSWENLVTACKKCNARKGDFTPNESGMKLLQKPYKPSYIMFLKDFSGKIDVSWKPYL